MMISPSDALLPDRWKVLFFPTAVGPVRYDQAVSFRSSFIIRRSVLNFFSSSYLLMEMMVGRPWGQCIRIFQLRSSSIRASASCSEQPVVSLHRRLAGHGGDLFVDQILAIPARDPPPVCPASPAETPFLAMPKRLPGTARTAYSFPPNGSISKPMAAKRSICVFKSSSSCMAKTAISGGLTSWAVYSLVLQSRHRPLIQHLLMSRMLVDDIKCSREIPPASRSQRAGR